MVLGARGLVGFDLSSQAYFHRELPFDLSEVEKLQPRLKAARQILDNEQISLTRRAKSFLVEKLIK